MCDFKKDLPLSKRLELLKRINEKYPNTIPVIVETNSFKLSKTKFMVPYNTSVGGFINGIKENASNQLSGTIFLYCDDKLIATHIPIEHLYDQYKNIDGFLYVQLILENPFMWYNLLGYISRWVGLS